MRPRETRKETHRAKHPGAIHPSSQPSTHPTSQPPLHPSHLHILFIQGLPEGTRTVLSSPKYPSIHPSPRFCSSTGSRERQGERERDPEETQTEKTQRSAELSVAVLLLLLRRRSVFFLLALRSRHCSRIRRSQRLLASRGAVNVHGSSHPGACTIINHCTRIM